ncbi:MAG: nucleoside hydrolase [Oscillospiraceae bacterium]|nr:nucleoside hydrolase [Oscillospiraceae bacterium]MBQ9148234.1 nucleoside hydrolase [Oscillospiraceae bacterium]
MKMFIDCDPGVDDSIAILFALYRKDVEIVGISTSVGNVSAAQGAQNALRILKLAGFEGQIPVCAGAEKPLCGETEDFPAFIHGVNGTGDIELPASSQQPVDMDVSDFMYQKACEHEGELVLVTLGRMTNVANTLAKYPDYARKIKRVVAMGGTVYSHGNVSPVVEANIGGDPEAADITMLADWDLTLVGLDVTLKTHLKREDVDKLLRCCNPAKKDAVSFISDELWYYMNGSRVQNYTMEYSPLHDPLAMVVAVDPSVVTTRKMVTRVECGGTYCRGKIVVDLREQPIDGRFVEHCLDVDSRKALNELFAAFQK